MGMRLYISWTQSYHLDSSSYFIEGYYCRLQNTPEYMYVTCYYIIKNDDLLITAVLVQSLGSTQAWKALWNKLEQTLTQIKYVIISMTSLWYHYYSTLAQGMTSVDEKQGWCYIFRNNRVLKSLLFSQFGPKDLLCVEEYQCNYQIKYQGHQFKHQEHYQVKH